ncbi:MAG: hypothetical protein JXB17_01260 [Bacteroidales bacterium]|nr:hypothetical protein [Bacteroidales bacterium]
MKKKLKLLAFSLMATFTCCQAANDTLRWQSEKITVDGYNSEWGSTLQYYDAETKLLYDMRNDSTNLYMTFETPDKMMQMKLMQVGFKISFKIKTKPKIVASIVFPKLPENAFKKEDIQTSNRPNSSFIKEKFLIYNDPATIEGFLYSFGSIFKENPNEDEILFSINWDNSDVMIYELKIPLREFYGDDFKFSEITQNDISLQAEIEALEETDMSGGMPRGDMKSSSPGGRMPPSGGMHGGSMGGPPGGMNQPPRNNQKIMPLFQKQSFSHKFNLSGKK